jgi:hypothetical protein
VYVRVGEKMQMKGRDINNDNVCTKF